MCWSCAPQGRLPCPLLLAARTRWVPSALGRAPLALGILPVVGPRVQQNCADVSLNAESCWPCCLSSCRVAGGPGRRPGCQRRRRAPRPCRHFSPADGCRPVPGGQPPPDPPPHGEQQAGAAATRLCRGDCGPSHRPGSAAVGAAHVVLISAVFPWLGCDALHLLLLASVTFQAGWL